MRIGSQYWSHIRAVILDDDESQLTETFCKKETTKETVKKKEKRLKLRLDDSHNANSKQKNY